MRATIAPVWLRRPSLTQMLVVKPWSASKSPTSAISIAGVVCSDSTFCLASRPAAQVIASSRVISRSLAVDDDRDRLAFAFVERRAQRQPLVRHILPSGPPASRSASQASNSGLRFALAGVELAAEPPATSPCSASHRGRSAAGGTTSTGGVSLMLPSRTACVVLSKNADSE